jgi:hypothetical protein
MTAPRPTARRDPTIWRRPALLWLCGHRQSRAGQVEPTLLEETAFDSDPTDGSLAGHAAGRQRELLAAESVPFRSPNAGLPPARWHG